MPCKVSVGCLHGLPFPILQSYDPWYPREASLGWVLKYNMCFHYDYIKVCTRPSFAHIEENRSNYPECLVAPPLVHSHQQCTVLHTSVCTVRVTLVNLPQICTFRTHLSRAFVGFGLRIGSNMLGTVLFKR